MTCNKNTIIFLIACGSASLMCMIFNIFFYKKYYNWIKIVMVWMDAESGQSTEKTVALVVGGVAALGFGIACLMFVRTAFKKHHSSKY